MKRLLLLLCLLLASVAPASAAFSLVGSVDGVGENNPTTGTLDTSGANLIVVHVAGYVALSGTLTDSKSNTWVPLTVYGTLSQLFYSLNPTVGSGHTFTYTQSTIYGVVSVQAWSGAHASSSYERENGVLDGAVTSVQTGSVTPDQDNSLIVAAATPQLASVDITINSGFTATSERLLTGGSNAGAMMAYLVQTSLGAVNPTFTWTTSSTVGASIAVFRAAAAATSRPSLGLMGVGR